MGKSTDHVLFITTECIDFNNITFAFCWKGHRLYFTAKCIDGFTEERALVDGYFKSVVFTWIVRARDHDRGARGNAVKTLIIAKIVDRSKHHSHAKHRHASGIQTRRKVFKQNRRMASCIVSDSNDISKGLHLMG
jgi:hypothetical protein